MNCLGASHYGATALCFERRPATVSTKALPGLGIAATIAGVAADAAPVRGGFACASPDTAGAGGAPG